jgi:enamine deaminase RidA (YjgF/YER057c/UK114 family)
MVAKLKYILVVPVVSATFDEQVNNCFAQVDEKLEKLGLKKGDVIRQTVFVKTASNQEYLELKQKATKLSNQYFEHPIPLSIISQYPENNSLVSMEFVCLDGSANSITRINSSIGGQSYLKLVTEDCIMVIASGVTVHSDKTDVLVQSESAFELVQGILDNEKMTFSNILRQWNYIERIIDFDESHGQHYQIFNDVRSHYYSKCNWEGGYPAATGIGMHHGGVIIDFIAVKPLKSCGLVSIKSPVQADAHQYSRKVLEISGVKTICQKTTPKFERAKMLMHGNSGQLYVSGTAAIKGEETISNMDVETQLKVTLTNIEELCATTNLVQHSINSEPSNNTHLSSARVYVKNPNEISKVGNLFKQLLPHCDVLVLGGEICRSSLLVEVEGIVDLQINENCL